MADVSDSDELWIFGYGSLVWRPDFPHVEQRPAIARGWARRLWQGSTDHRGVPGSPGRVATLVPMSGAEVWGRAFRVPASDRAQVLARLDHREKGGYDRVRVPLFDPLGRTFAAGLAYLANADNPEWLGPAALRDMVAQIQRSRGPSGPNDLYVTELAQALYELGAHDAHVFELASALGWRPGPPPPREGGRTDEGGLGE
ncbi:MAG: gamma-glutamylcyclotransferase [Deltaproteobacteria bacterium]|nr:MAG: gamma-glutamylcyclotransferase [Deltaproteobacteria bacterium]